MQLGKRGEGYVVIQLLLLLLVAVSPWLDQNTFYGGAIVKILGGLFLVIAIGIAIVSITKLGQNLTALPQPKAQSQLVASGIYAFIRHPIYSSLMLISLGWALWHSSLVTFGSALLLCIWLELKSRREEAYLQEKFANYPAYAKKVKKFIPFIY
jgi:protein-S-isoprenylcysteine O-methyltransferase Ste14